MSNLGEIGEPRVGGLSGIFLWTGVLILDPGVGWEPCILLSLLWAYCIAYQCISAITAITAIASINQLCIRIINFVLDAKPFTAEMNTKERRSEIFMSSYSVCLEYLLRNYHCEPQPPT